MPQKIVIVGIGGVGSRLAPVMCQYLAYADPGSQVLLVDGDNFEPKNADRQIFGELGNKAEVTATQIQAQYPQLTVEGKSKFITEDNIFVFVKDGDIVFCCVDNHASRKLLSEHCATLQNVTLISGGNDFDDGNIQVYSRRGGKDLTSPLTHLHPELAEPADKNPATLSCEERAQTGTPQLIFANLKVATEMAAAYYVSTLGKPKYGELYFDLKTGAQRPINR